MYSLINPEVIWLSSLRLQYIALHPYLEIILLSNSRESINDLTSVLASTGL